MDGKIVANTNNFTWAILPRLHLLE